MNPARLLNVAGLLLGFVGAALFWWIGRTENGGLAPYASKEVLDQVGREGARRKRFKDFGMAMIALAFLMQLIAVLL